MKPLVLVAVCVLASACWAVAGCGQSVSPRQEAVAADHYLAGQLYMDQGNLELALEELARAVEINPKMSLAYSRMGVIYKTRGQMEQAARAYERAVELDEDSFADLVQLAAVYQGLERFGDALSAYVRAATLDPDDYDAHFELGTLYFKMNRLADAEEAFQRCIEIDGARPEALAHLGVVYDAQGRYYDASRAFRESIERKLEQPLVMINLANTYLKQGRCRSAVDVLKIAGGLAPDNAMIPELMGNGYFLLANYDPARAARYGAARAEEYEQARQARYEQARDCYLRAIELDRNNHVAMARLGTVQMILSLKTADAGRQQLLRKEAVDYWHRSLELNPNQPKITSLLDKYGPQRQATDVLGP